MIALFYDRKNRCIVRSDELVETKVIAEVIQGDSQETDLLVDPLSELMKFEIDGVKGSETVFPGLLSWHTIMLGEIGYKSKDCPSYMNFDRYCMQSDLVFLEMVK